MKCCICKNEIDGFGNNPQPYKKRGRCCDDCNSYYVIPYRILLLIKPETPKVKTKGNIKTQL